MGTSEPEANNNSETNDGLKKKSAVDSGREKESGHDSSRLSPGEDDKNTQLASEENGDGTPVSNRSSVDRPDDSYAEYRIPSSVFKRNKSSAPMDWSVASNESLFSIYMENTSFTRNRSWLGKSGELGLAGEISNLSASVSPMLNYSNKHHQNNLSPIKTSSTNESAEHDSDVKVSDSKAAETMRESHKREHKQIKAIHRSHIQQRIRHRYRILQKVFLESAGSQNKAQAENHSPEITPKPSSNSSQNKWLACLPCCSSRS